MQLIRAGRQDHDRDDDDEADKQASPSEALPPRPLTGSAGDGGGEAAAGALQVQRLVERKVGALCQHTPSAWIVVCGGRRSAGRGSTPPPLGTRTTR
jgi:hypothetical protein